MGNQEEEFICSDCGAPVTDDIKICPNCGANMEEISEDEDEFIEIPVTSHPVDLSSILSLLDEKKIEYSVNDDPMDNIWGSNFIQLPRLLIRQDQYEAVKEIIDAFENNDIKIIDESVHSADASEINIFTLQENKKDKTLKGVEGWLLFFCMMLLLGPCVYLPYNINTYFQLNDEPNWIPLKDFINTIDLIVTILISGISIYSGWLLWKINSNAIKTTKYYLNIVLVYTLLYFTLTTIIFSKMQFNSVIQNIYGEVLRETISSIIYVVIWKLYLKNSARVKNTYGTSLEFKND